MEKPVQSKVKNNKKQATKPKPAKKPKSDGPTCSMFLAELARKLALKKKEETESPKNIVHAIIDSITNALPVIFTKRSPPRKESPMKIETLQTFAPELLPCDVINISSNALTNPAVKVKKEPALRLDSREELLETQKTDYKMPRMPLANSDVLKLAAKKRRQGIVMEDATVGTSGSQDVANDIAKYVGTLKKISLIAEEFNQKTAKNLKEIVDSVQEELIKKLEDLQAEKRHT